jgi:hypothetical protein
MVPPCRHRQDEIIGKCQMSFPRKAPARAFFPGRRVSRRVVFPWISMALDAIFHIWHDAPYMKAARAFYDRAEFPDGAIVEMTIWLVPVPVVGSGHAFKYSLFYGHPGQRVIGYDNERGKGDHRHVEGKEEPYAFSTVEVLMADFLADVRRVRGES